MFGSALLRNKTPRLFALNCSSAVPFSILTFQLTNSILCRFSGTLRSIQSRCPCHDICFVARNHIVLLHLTFKRQQFVFTTFRYRPQFTPIWEESTEVWRGWVPYQPSDLITGRVVHKLSKFVSCIYPLVLRSHDFGQRHDSFRNFVFLRFWGNNWCI